MKSFLNKNKEALGGIIIIVLAFYVGRYTSPTKVETKNVTIEIEKIKQHQDTIIVEKVNKDGSKETTTRIITDTDKDASKTSEQTKIVENKPSLNVYALGGLDVTNPANGFIVGAHVSKQLLGPISIGVFGFTNKTVGVSVGMSF